MFFGTDDLCLKCGNPLDEIGLGGCLCTGFVQSSRSTTSAETRPVKSSWRSLSFETMDLAEIADHLAGNLWTVGSVRRCSDRLRQIDSGQPASISTGMSQEELVEVTNDHSVNCLCPLCHERLANSRERL